MSIDTEINELPWEALGESIKFTPLAALRKLAEHEHAETTWLARFQGTSLFPAAVALSQKELAVKEARLRRAIARESDQVSNTDYNVSEMLRLQKKKLDIELAVQQNSAATEGTEKVAKEMTERQRHIAERVDDAGIGILAAPYLARAAAKLKGRRGLLGAVGNAATPIANWMHHKEIPMEVAGLALVAPGITNAVARGISHIKGSPNK